MSGILPCYRDRVHIDQLVATERQQRTGLKTRFLELPPEERWVQLELPFYEEQFSKVEGLNVAITTFNVGCKKPPADLKPLVPKLCSSDGSPVDLVVIGLQEVDMSAAAIWKEETDAATPWVVGLAHEIGAHPLFPASGASAVGGGSPASTSALATAAAASTAPVNVGMMPPQSPQTATPLDERMPYVMLSSKQLVGLLLCTFVRRAVLPFVEDVLVTTTATGALGSLGNKGGIGISLKVHMTSLCIITAHLAAGQTQVNKRNEDIQTIFSSMDFHYTKRQATLSTGIIDMSELLPVKLPRDHDILVVAGDLNYRLNLSYETAVSLANNGDTAALLREDQLIAELKSPHTPWHGFIDLLPTFRPTYRFDIGTNTYDTSEKRRIPSYTDRILHWAKSSALRDSVEVKKFTALTQILSSDHKPVQFIGVLPVRAVVPDQQKVVLERLRKTASTFGLDRVSTAKTSVSAASLDFGIQEFHHCGARRTLTIANQGECVASVRVFRQQNEASQGLWLRVAPSTFHVLPGESKEIVIEASLDRQSLGWIPVWLPYKGQASVRLKSSLVFHVFGGPVHLVECITVVQPSVFGNTLDNIVRLENNSCMDAYASSSPPNVATSVLKPRLPKELWFMGDAILKRGGVKFPGIFCETSPKEACADIMSYLDRNNKPLPEEFAVDLIASTMLHFLSSLQEPIIPNNLFESALSSIRTGGKVPLFFVQQQLPPLHANVFLYVVSLMNFLLRPQNAQSNELTPATVAQVLAQVLMPRPGKDATDSGRSVTAQQHRTQIQQDHDDAVKFMLFFLTPPPVMMSS